MEPSEKRIFSIQVFENSVESVGKRNGSSFLSVEAADPLICVLAASFRLNRANKTDIFYVCQQKYRNREKDFQVLTAVV